MKNARAYLQNEQVLSSDWSAPVLKGVVQAGGTSYRSGLVIKTSSDIENICTCRPSREDGIICAHSVAVGLHYLRGQTRPLTPEGKREKRGAAKEPKGPQQSSADVLQRSESGESLELFIIFPPNVEQALARRKVMLCFEGAWKQGRSPLNALPRSTTFKLSEQDQKVLAEIEALAGGITPPMLVFQAEQFAQLLPMLVEHPRITLGRATPVAVTTNPFRIPIRAELQANGEIVLSL